MGDANPGPVGREQLDTLLVNGGELLRQNRVGEARKAFLDALEIEPDNVRALGLLGLACFRMNDFAGALPVYQRLVALNGNDASFSLNLGLVHLKLGNAQEAIRQLERTRELDPSQSRAVSYLGLAYARNGHYAKAYQAFLQAGQSELAREMEQYLSEVEREQIKAAVASGGRAGLHAGREPGQEPGREPGQQAGDKSDQATSAAPASVAPAAGAPQPGAAQEPPGPQPGAGAAQEEDTQRPEDTQEIEEADVVSISNEDASDEDAVEPVSPSGVVRAAVDGKAPGVISQAVAKAAPSTAAAAGAARVAMGHDPPQPLSEFATARLIRPGDGDHTFETSAGGVLIVRVRGRVFTRTEGVNVSGGELAYEVASRRVRGSTTDEDFSSDGCQLFVVSGHGHLIASPLGEHFTAVTLDEDILYLREDLVYAFEDGIRWENGFVPGSSASMRMVQFRGQGAVAFRSKRPLLSIKLAPERVLYIDAHVLAGWIGRVIPRAVAPAAGGEKSTLFVECTGEGVILIEDEDDSSLRHVLLGARPVETEPSSQPSS